MRLIVGLMCVFQIWLSMNGIQAIFAETVLGGAVGVTVAYAAAAFFMLLLLRFGMIRNVLTDNVSWTAVYGVALALTAAALLRSRGSFNPLPMGLEPVNMGVGIEKGLLLLPGAFLYPYFFEILDYNDANADGAQMVNVRRAFIVGGLLFGAYLIFPLLLAVTSFGPALGIVKAVLVTLVAVSTLSSFLYSVYIAFGRKLGLVINAASIALWQWVIPLGVMGVWTLMAQVRIWIVAGSIALALAWAARVRRRAVSA